MAVILQGEMLRALASLLLSLLLLITVIWGGCISCEQYFMFGQAHSCCNLDGHCKRKAPVQNSSGHECKQIAFDYQKGIDLHFDLQVAAVERIALPVRNIELLPRWREALPFNPSPPDLQVLHSIFLI